MSASPKAPAFKAYDKVLDQWFQASTRAELLRLMNQPSIAIRRAAMQLQAIVDGEGAMHTTARLKLAKAKRLRKRAANLLKKDT